MHKLVTTWDSCFGNNEKPKFFDLAMLLFRVSIGLMLISAHGLGKIQVLFSGGNIQFADPIGIGVVLSFF